MSTEKLTYGYNQADYKKFKQFAWKMLLSFGLTYMFFYNGRQNINLVLTAFVFSNQTSCLLTGTL